MKIGVRVRWWATNEPNTISATVKPRNTSRLFKRSFAGVWRCGGRHSQHKRGGGRLKVDLKKQVADLLAEEPKQEKKEKKKKKNTHRHTHTHTTTNHHHHHHHRHRHHRVRWSDPCGRRLPRCRCSTRCRGAAWVRSCRRSSSSSRGGCTVCVMRRGWCVCDGEEGDMVSACLLHRPCCPWGSGIVAREIRVRRGFQAGDRVACGV